MKSVQELAREFALQYESKAEYEAAFKAFQEGFRYGNEGKSRDDWDLTFAPIEWRSILYDWLVYKKEKRQSYKSQRTIMQMYNKLYRDCNGDVDYAKATVEFSIANNYSGLFQPKNYYNGKSNNQFTQGCGTIYQTASDIRQRRGQQAKELTEQLLRQLGDSSDNQGGLFE